jgi:hypothetical protein
MTSYNLGVKEGRKWRSNAPPTATDAARKLAKLINDDMRQPGETVATRKNRFEDILENVLDLVEIKASKGTAVADPATLTRECPSSQRGVVWVLPTGPEEGKEVDEKCVFDENGKLNPECRVGDYQAQKDKYVADDEELRKYAAGEIASLNNDNNAGDFLLPSRHSSTTVTARSSKINGGKQ